MQRMLHLAFMVNEMAKLAEVARGSCGAWSWPPIVAQVYDTFRVGGGSEFGGFANLLQQRVALATADGDKVQKSLHLF